MKDRLVSLDVFRGTAVALMILVNNPGSWSAIYPPFRHAQWSGWTPTDLVFPFFLFSVGVAISLSFAKRRPLPNLNQTQQVGFSANGLVRKILWRSLIIFALGIFLNGFPFGLPLQRSTALDFQFKDILNSFSDIRFWGVLQRIAICYLVAGLLAVRISSWRKMLVSAGVLLAVYECLMRIPLAAGWGAGSFDLADNFVRYVDLKLLGDKHLYHIGSTAFDPEGLVSSLPAIVTTISGYLAGEYFRHNGSQKQSLLKLSVIGLALFMLGYLYSVVEPINKQLWTGSYVLLTAGLALVLMAIFAWVIDLRKWHHPVFPMIVFGSNPLVAFVGSGLLARILYLVRVTDSQGKSISLKLLLYRDFFKPLAGSMNGSLLYAVTMVLLWLAILWYLYRRRIFVKV